MPPTASATGAQAATAEVRDRFEPVVAPSPDAPPEKGHDGDQPWNWPWWRCRPGERRTLTWIILIHVLAVVGLIVTPVPGMTVFIVAATLAFLGGLGTTVGYHRGLAHLSVRMRRPVETLLTFFAIFNGSGAPQSWAANHRKHHANADKESDISSPGRGGFWWSHLRWLWQAPTTCVKRWAPDLDTPYYRFWSKWQWLIVLVSLTCGGLLGWAGFFWIGAIRLVVSLHGQCFVNSIAHMREDAAPGEDASQNIVWLGFIQYFQGENWHGNHHAKPWSARIGWTWWQVDLGWTFIRALEVTGLATKVNRPR